MRQSAALDEEAILLRLRRGDESVLDQLVEQYAGLVTSIVRRRLSSYPACWEECVNDVLLAVWNHRLEFDPAKGSLANWIGAIAKFKAIDALRRHMRSRQDLPLEEEAELVSVRGPEEELLDRELSAELEQLLNHLSPEDRALFWEHYVERQDLSMLSRRHGLSLSALYSRFSRGKRRLRKIASPIERSV